MRVERFSQADWRLYSEKAHLICFGQHKPAHWDRFDFALLAVDHEKPLGYVTCREHDPETLYWQFGGTFPETKGTIKSWRVYEALTNYCRSNYRRLTTLIENDNLTMLKFAMKMGYRIVGVRVFQGKPLLDHLLELA